MKHRVFFSLSSNVIVFFIPLDYAIFITLCNILLFIITARIFQSLFIGVFVIILYLVLFAIGAILTKKDRRWFDVFRAYFVFYSKNLKLMFKNNYKYIG